MGLPLALPEGRDPDSGSHSPAGVHHAYSVCRRWEVPGRPSPRGMGWQDGFLSPGSGADGTDRRAPRPRKAPGAGPGYLCQRCRHRPSRWVGTHAPARGRLVVGTKGSGVGAEVGAGAMGETGGTGTTRGGTGGGGGAGGAGGGGGAVSAGGVAT